MSNRSVEPEAYETIPVRVKVQTFAPSGPNSNIFVVKLVRCSCDATDSYTCNQHKNFPRYDFVVDGTRNFVNSGDKVVIFPGHKVDVYGPAEFARLFRKVVG